MLSWLSPKLLAYHSELEQANSSFLSIPTNKPSLASSIYQHLNTSNLLKILKEDTLTKISDMNYPLPKLLTRLHHRKSKRTMNIANFAKSSIHLSVELPRLYANLAKA